MEKSARAFIIVAIAAVVVMAIYGLVLSLNFSGWDERGQFGDMFGAVNALFSGLALAGVIFAVLLQSEELKLQREDIKLQRLDFKESMKIHQENADASSLASEIQVIAAYTDSLGSQIRHLRRERGNTSNSTEDVANIDDRIVQLQDNLEKEFWRIGELRKKMSKD